MQIVSIGLVLFLLSDFALAKEAYKPKADLTVRVIQSTVNGNSIYRAVQGFDEIYPYLVIEKIEKGLTEGENDKLVKSWNAKSLADQKSTIFDGEGTQILDLHWNGINLEFIVKKSESDQKKCIISKVDAINPALSCK